MEKSPEPLSIEGQLTLFEVRTFLGRTVLILDNICYPQYQLDDNEGLDGTPEPLIG